MELKIFTLPNCPKCPEAKRITKEVSAKLGVDYLEFDLATPDGGLEGLMYQIMSAPSIALDNEVLVKGRVPSQGELENEIKKRLGK